MDPPSANLSCIGGLIDPQMILAAKTKRREGLGGRTVDASMLMRAAVRQTEAEVEALQSSTLLSTVVSWFPSPPPPHSSPPPSPPLSVPPTPLSMEGYIKAVIVWAVFWGGCNTDGSVNASKVMSVLIR